MSDGLKAMAGLDLEPHTEAARLACLAELRPVIAKLLRQGMPPGTIIAALAFASIDLTAPPPH